MLSAILNGKGRRLPSSLPAGASLRMAFVQSEDILTSTVFERLAYLDGATLWGLLVATFRPRIFPERRIAELEQIEFWPMWGQAKETLEAAVEPDVVLRFSVGDPAQEIVLIVECKLGGMQYPDQWAREWIAYRAENSSDGGGSETYLLALGGMPANAEAMVGSFTETVRKGYGVDVKATAADWRDLLKALNEIEPVRASDRRVIDDVRAALALHGYSHFTPMSELGALAASYRIASTAGGRLRWSEDASVPDRVIDEPPVQPVPAADLDPLAGWVERIVPFRSLGDHRSLRWSNHDA